MNTRTRWAVICLIAVLLSGPMVLAGGLVMLSGSPADEASGSTMGGGYNDSDVPATFRPWILRAAQTCPPAVGGALLAAQLSQESGFDPTAVSPVGAQGAAQFMPGTWPGWGRDDDGNGVASPFDIGDAVMAQARYDCHLLEVVQGFLREGVITKPDRDPMDLMLAAYNAGPGGPGSPRGVYGAGGIPVNGQTELYVPLIRGLMVRFGWIEGLPVGVPSGDGSFGSAVVATAVSYQGLPYRFGGGNFQGPTLGPPAGFDCSGLVLRAVYVASRGRLRLPHLADEQARLGAEVASGVGSTIDLSLLRPGDAIAFKDDPANPNTYAHIGIYVGAGQMVAAPHTGDVVRTQPVTIAYWQRLPWSVRRFG